ncbi:AraC family transcriptional regulator [Paenibacillus lactis]|uniref:AraC-like DNA-binding protein/mannose-6-phosphate isomerase-like protein (Cupin superfamily) n=1 Tax=Paenibacillus lactis TaxID=228574 RepID=A0ABS4FD98_9BACL|nr:AraC family transcriptional regulator [Paenibacillus lactis]MBP1894232.1 AraC-like DNA-binding protein/mannose-6-phosphate isomerase-like protein (cupin superfamily) [Paenibacillus lactis]HAF99590.1 AraC family transcriptional regulator [Paenibacillus lactis]
MKSERSEQEAIQQMLLNMQVQILEAKKTQCWPEWRELDYTVSYNKLYFILEGEGWVKIGKEELYPKPGQLILMPARTKQSYSTISDRPFLKYWCHFSAAVGDADVFSWLDVPRCYDLEQPLEMSHLFQELVDAHHTETVAARLKEKSVMLDILSRVFSDQEPQIHSHRTGDMERLNKVQQYVKDHLHEEITLEQMAGTLHLHPNYFIKYFKRHFGITPQKYLSVKRMERAKLLLRTTSLSIKEIADATGFESANYFSKTFRKEVGYSPSEYRNNI